MSQNLKIRCIDPIEAIELLAAGIEIGTAGFRLYKYLKTHPVSLKVPSFLYEMTQRTNTLCDGSAIFHIKTTIIFRIFKIQKWEQFPIVSHCPTVEGRRLRKNTSLWIQRRCVKEFVDLS